MTNGDAYRKVNGVDYSNSHIAKIIEVEPFTSSCRCCAYYGETCKDKKCVEGIEIWLGREAKK